MGWAHRVGSWEKYIFFLNLPIGLIADTFGELRGKENERRENRQNTCFICNIKRQDFEKHGTFRTRRASGPNSCASEGGAGMG